MHCNAMNTMPVNVEWNCLPTESNKEPLTANPCDLLHIHDTCLLQTFTVTVIYIKQLK